MDTVDADRCDVLNFRADTKSRNSCRRERNDNRIHRHVDNGGKNLHQRGWKADFNNLSHALPIRLQGKGKRNLRIPFFIDQHSGKAAHELTDDCCKRSSGRLHARKAEPAENENRIENQIGQ